MPLVVIAPLVGIAIVPVTPPVGAGLTPNDVISVESIGIPAGPTDPPRLIPRGEVVPSEGIAVSGSSTSAWANAGPAHANDQAVAAINNGLMPTAAINVNFIGIPSRNPLRRSESRSTTGAKRLRSISRLDSGRPLARTQLNTRLLFWPRSDRARPQIELHASK